MENEIYERNAFLDMQQSESLRKASEFLKNEAAKLNISQEINISPLSSPIHLKKFKSPIKRKDILDLSNDLTNELNKSNNNTSELFSSNSSSSLNTTNTNNAMIRAQRAKIKALEESIEKFIDIQSEQKKELMN